MPPRSRRHPPRRHREQGLVARPWRAMPLLVAWRIWAASYRAGHVSDALWGAALPLWRHAANVNAIPQDMIKEAA